MKTYKLNDMKMGWFIGAFAPAVIQTEGFEVGYTTHKKDEYRAPHFHKEATEITLVISGELLINDYKFIPGDIFVISPEEVARPKFLTDVSVVVIKIPSVLGDKYLVED